MKKNIFIVCILMCIIIVFILIGITVINSQKIEEVKETKRYAEIKSEIDKELQRYMYIAAPYCKKDGASRLITHKDLVYNAGMNKESFLDIDGKSYCGVYVDTNCVEDGKWEWKIYLSCKNYEDKGYIEWDKPFNNK